MHRERHVKLCLNVDLSSSSDALPTVSPCASRSRHTTIRDGYTERDAGADADVVSLCNLVFLFLFLFLLLSKHVSYGRTIPLPHHS